MEIINYFGKEELATVYLARMKNGKIIEFVDSCQPPIPKDKKWVLIVSVSYGCPIKCLMCDAGGNYSGNLSEDDIFQQIDYLVLKRYNSLSVPVEKFKIQFARIGEPAFNLNVINVLEKLPFRYDAKGLVACISTIAPEGKDYFFQRLLEVKNRFYLQGKFQLQFSIHSTDEKIRDTLMPYKKWGLQKIAEYGEDFFIPGDKKITLNFAVSDNIPIQPEIIANYFSPEKFFIKITPTNPTYNAIKNRLDQPIEDKHYKLAEKFKQMGYDTLISIGELEENQIGSNCGQYITTFLQLKKTIPHSYTFVTDSMRI